MTVINFTNINKTNIHLVSEIMLKVVLSPPLSPIKCLSEKLQNYKFLLRIHCYIICCLSLARDIILSYYHVIYTLYDFPRSCPQHQQKKIVRNMSILDFQSYLTYLISFLLDILNFNLNMFVFHLKTYYQQIITSNVSKTVSKVLESVYSKNLSNTKYIVLYTPGV